MGALITRTQSKSEIDVNYQKNDIVSFTKEGKEIKGRISKVTCTLYTPNMCNLGESYLTVIDDSSRQHKVSLTEPTLRIENMTMEEANIYEIGDTVSFSMDERIKTGKIISFVKVVIPNTNNISIRESYLTIALNNPETQINIPFTQTGLKILSGKDLNVVFEVGDHVILKIDDKYVVVEITGTTIYRNQVGNVDGNTSSIGYKYKNGIIERINWGSVIKKVDKSTPLSFQDISKKKKYTLEEDSKYRVKYMKYKAKYLAQKNN
jgi:hypothetical protein